MDCVIVIPCYRDKMDRTEEVSLLQCARIFGGRRDIVLAVPETLDCSLYLSFIPSARLEKFDDKFFTSVSSYSHLLLTPEFYLRFQKYEYMLIYQLDAWVFRDELDEWCAKGYDYIGAPFIQKFGKREKVLVGNGGFSLRRIDAILRVLGNPETRMFPSGLLLDFFRSYLAAGLYLKAFNPLLKLLGLYPNSRGDYLKKIRHEKFNSEDVVFYFLSQKFTKDGLTMPEPDEAALFSLDVEPERFFKKLPSGCHAWMKDQAPFWKGRLPIEYRNDL